MPKKSYVVKAGDSYASIAGKQLGDQRGFGDLARLNGHRALRPGDVIYIGPRRKSYFVSGQDVALAQGSVNENYKGPVMQSYGQYQQNYNQVNNQAVGGAGGSFPTPNFAGNTTGQQNASQWQQGIPTAGPNVVANQPNSVANQTYRQETGIENAQTWQRFKQPPTMGVQAPATGVQNSPVMAPTLDPVTGQMRVDVQGGQFGQQISNNRQGMKDIGPASGATVQSAGNRKYEYGGGWNNPAVQSKLVTQVSGNKPGTGTTPGQVNNTQAQALYEQQEAVNVVTAFQSNANVPNFVSSGAAQHLIDAAAADPRLGVAISSVYDYDNHGNFVPKGSLLLPGSQNSANFFASSHPDSFIPDTYDYTYSNTPPRGYNSPGNVYSNTGRPSNGSNTPATPLAMQEQDFNVNIGQ